MPLLCVELVGRRAPSEFRAGPDAVHEVVAADQILARSENGDDHWSFGCGRVQSRAGALE